MTPEAERERAAYFSNTSLVPPPVLVARADTLAALPMNGGEADLAQLLADRKHRGAIVENRSYGRHVDAQLARAAHANIEKTATGDYGRNVLQMVAHGRADFTFDYDFALAYGQAVQGELGQLRTVAIAGNTQAVEGLALVDRCRALRLRALAVFLGRLDLRPRHGRAAPDRASSCAGKQAPAQGQRTRVRSRMHRLATPRRHAYATDTRQTRPA